MDARHVGDELMRTTAALRRLVRRRWRAEGREPQLRGAQTELLRLVEDQPGVGIAAAARALQLAPNTVSTLVNQLLDAGLVARRISPGDRRAARLYLTGDGEKRLTAWREARSELIGVGVARLSPADAAALERALPALRNLIAALDGSPDA